MMFLRRFLQFYYQKRLKIQIIGLFILFNFTIQILILIVFLVPFINHSRETIGVRTKRSNRYPKTIIKTKPVNISTKSATKTLTLPNRYLKSCSKDSKVSISQSIVCSLTTKNILISILCPTEPVFILRSKNILTTTSSQKMHLRLKSTSFFRQSTRRLWRTR